MNMNGVPEVSSRPLKMRSQAEVKAQYEVKIKKYNELMQAQGDHREQLHCQQRGRGARAHDKRVEDEEGKKLGARIQPAH